MSQQVLKIDALDPDGKWLYRVGGVSAIVFGIAYIIIIALYTPMGAPPSDAEARLSYIAGHTTAWWGILSLSVLTDFLLVPVVLSLYISLKGINKYAMLAAAAFVGLFIVLDLALTWTNYAVLIDLSGKYAAATSDVQRAVVVASANYPSTVLGSNLVFVYNSLTLAVGILITGLVMLEGIFSKLTAYLGVLTGILGIAAVAGAFFVNTSMITIVASALTTLWVLLVGYRLFRLGQQ